MQPWIVSSQWGSALRGDPCLTNALGVLCDFTASVSEQVGRHATRTPATQHEPHRQLQSAASITYNVGARAQQAASRPGPSYEAAAGKR